MYYVVQNIRFVDAGLHLAGSETSTNQMHVFIMVQVGVETARNGTLKAVVEQVVDPVYQSGSVGVQLTLFVS